MAQIAAEPARHCTLVLADLRGYGASSVPADTAEHRSFAKQTMALDCLAEIESGHFLAEENPRAMLAAVPPIIAAHGVRR